MIEISGVRVFGWEVNRLHIEWSVRDTQEDVEEYTFDVYRSESEYGPFDRITARPLRDRYVFTDINPPLQNFDRQLWYCIEVRHLPTGESYRSAAVMREGTLNRYGRQIQRHHMTLMRAFIGRVCWLYPIRTFGQKCPACTVDLTGITNIQDCPTCYGTGFARAYHYPIQFSGQITGSEASIQISNQNQGQVYMHNVTTAGASPRLHPNDMVIDDHNNRYRITKVSGTQMIGVNVHFEGSMVLLPRSDICYSIQHRPDEATVRLPAALRADSHSGEAERVDGAGLPDLLRFFPA